MIINLELAQIPSRGRGARALPTQGQRVRISVLKETELWQGNHRVLYPEGQSYAGTVTMLSDDDLLDLLMDDGQQIRIYAREPRFEIEII